MRLDYTYVCAQDYARAVDWYRDILFRDDWVLQTDRFTYWRAGDSHFGVFDPSVTGETVTVGNNAVPNFLVEDVAALYGRLSKVAEIVLPLQSVNGTRLFQCRDPGAAKVSRAEQLGVSMTDEAGFLAILDAGELLESTGA